MIDVMTKQPLRVLHEGVRPFLELPESQLKEVEELLRRNDIYFWTEEDVVSDDNGRWIATINFHRDADPASIQATFDDAVMKIA
jgi:hypothetical protein